MADTLRTLTALLANIPIDTVGGISAQDVRDLLYSVAGVIPYVAKTANYTATENDEFIAVDATSGAVTITLPPVATTRGGKRYVIKKIDSSGNAVTADGNASETIDGATTKATSTQWASFTLINTGSAWLVEG